jgi:GntR family transcriptional repressor for pyruvate dehydrogenase complex
MAEEDRAGFDAVLRSLASSTGFAGEGVAHLLEVRKVLEAEAARLAALRADAACLSLLRDDVRRALAAVSAGRSLDQVDIDFHVHVAEASGNPLLASITRALFAAMAEAYKPSRDEMVSDARRRQAFLEQHRAVVEAIEARDPEAARQAMYVHLAVVEREVAGA